jgi:hypothetical protein
MIRTIARLEAMLFPVEAPCQLLRPEHYEEGFRGNEQSIRDFGTGGQGVMLQGNHSG